MLRIRDRSELSAAEDANESYSNNILVKLNTTNLKDFKCKNKGIQLQDQHILIQNKVLQL